MNNFTTQLYKALSQGYSINEIICQKIESTVNSLLKTELTLFLDYERYDPIEYNSGNSRNGSYLANLRQNMVILRLKYPEIAMVSLISR